ncbi:MAG: sensor histidine kinase [Chitinophagaceae bacterium]
MNTLISCAIIFIFAGVIYNSDRIKKKLNSQLQQRNELIDAQKKKIEGMNEQVKMKILQSKFNPHFLFNSLNSIQYFIARNDRKEALLYTARFAGFLRNVLRYSDELFITAEQEAGMLEQYLWLEQCRYLNRFEFKVKLIEAGRIHNAEVPPMLVHSLVVDALYLGVLNMGETKKGVLDIVFEVLNNELIIKVTDNGLERQQALAREQAKGIENINGLAGILGKRLELFNRKAVKKIEVTYKTKASTNTGFVNEAILVVPQPLFN